MSPRPDNYFLESLGADDFEFLRPHLKVITLKQGVVLFQSGGEITQIYFSTTAVISLVVQLSHGELVEAGMIGHDGVVGGSAALDGSLSLNQAVVQVGGQAIVIEPRFMRQAVEKSTVLRTLLYRHDQFTLAQAQQSAACFAKHDIEARLCRWLLRTRDLARSDTLPLTQEFIAEMLGVRRTSVTMIAKKLHVAGLINYRRGRIQLVDLDGIKDTSCECYDTVNAQKKQLLDRKPTAKIALVRE